MFDYLLSQTLRAIKREARLERIQHNRQIAREQDAAAAHEIMKHDVLSAHRDAPQFDIEHTVISYSHGAVLLTTFTRTQCETIRIAMTDGDSLY